ncbi:MAG TPA: vWA domain-containing protein [Bacillus sp. (in: firmicutes)]|uniref:vWA domain-containing protein n=1 Tax=Bacillus litorisediminis TaxID=2922713 RepID=UPI001FAE40C1|nr:vWA domain-containing protein [Bacillus litorisediminis]HWO78697.1 vWA domain-containing protein [Bacillus sp. (in: firmicutes)]
MHNSLTEIIFLLDRSGSMAGLESDTIAGFNSFIKRQCELKGGTILTTVLFDDQYEVLWDGIQANQAVLTEKEYYTRGSTALLDAVGKTIIDVGHRLSQTKEEQRPGKVIFVITTDGYENASREFTFTKVSELIRHQQEKYNWEFIFLGANMDAAKEADRFGISPEDAFNFEASNEGVESMYSVVCEAVMERRNK